MQALLTEFPHSPRIERILPQAVALEKSRFGGRLGSQSPFKKPRDLIRDVWISDHLYAQTGEDRSRVIGKLDEQGHEPMMPLH